MEFLQAACLWIIDHWEILKNWVADPVNQPTIIIISLIAAAIAILGIFKPILNIIAKPFLKKRTIKEVPLPTPSTKEIAEAAVAAFKDGQQSLQPELQARDQQIVALTKALETPQRKHSEAETKTEQTTINSALTHLTEGNISEAKAIFEEILKTQTKHAQEANKQAAIAARHIGALSFLHDTDKALNAYKRAVKLDPNNAEGWNELGHLQDRIGQLDQAIQSYETILRLGNNTADQTLIATALNNLGLIYGTQDNLEKAEDTLLKALQINEQLGNKQGMANSYTNLGNIYVRRGELEKAENTQLKALKINEQLGNEQGMAAIYGNLGIIYKTIGNLEKAEDTQLKSLKIEEQIGNKLGIAQSYTNLGVIYEICGAQEKAEDAHLKSLKINEQLFNKHGIAQNYGNLGNILKLKGNITEACTHWQKALELFTEVGAKREMEVVSNWLEDANCPAPKTSASD